METLPPINDHVIAAVSKLVDDAQASVYREPSHSDIEFYVDRSGLAEADPKRQGIAVGKAKRVRAILSWALEHKPDSGAELITALIAKIRACGGFRVGSENFVGREQIQSAVEAFASVGFLLSHDGDLQPKNIEVLSGRELTKALRAYAERAKRGSQDAALLVGTSKDLLEATAAHILTERYGSYPTQTNFPALLGQAFIALGMATPENVPVGNEPPHRQIERAMYQTACAINRLRNKQGTGHGRPSPPSVAEAESRVSAELAGAIAGYMLGKL